MASKALISVFDNYEKYISKKGVEEEVVKAYCEATNTAYIGENDVEFGMAHSKRAKDLILQMIKQATGGTFRQLEEWSQKNKQPVLLLEWYYDMLKLEAPFLVDSFKLYVEKNRMRQDRFYEPRRKTLIKISNAIQKLENDELDILFLHMPPRTGKSGDLTLDTVWHCARGMETSNLYVTYKEGLGGAFLDGVTEILTDPTYCTLDVFPGAKIADTDAKNNKIDLGRKKKYKTLSGKGLESGLNGEYDAYGWLIIDDPLEGVQDVLSKDTLHRKQIIFDNNVLSRAKEMCKIVLMGTLWGMNDLFGNYLEFLETNETGKRWDIIKIPALDPETDESNFEYDYNVGFSTKEYHMRRAKFEMNNDMAGWNAQYMQTPIERDGAVFNPDDMRMYKHLPSEGLVKKIAHCDVALGGGDFLSMPIVYCYENGEMYMEDVVFDNSEKHVTQPQIITKIKNHKLRNLHFEANQGGEGYKDDIQTKVKEDKDITWRVNISSDWAPTTKRKEQRIWDNAESIRQIYFKEPQLRDKQYRMFMQNLFSFTMSNNKHRHEDAADSLSGLIDFDEYGSGIKTARISGSWI